MNIMLRIEVIPYRRFGKENWPHFQGPTCCPETKVMNYHYTPRTIPEERRSLLVSCSGDVHFEYQPPPVVLDKHQDSVSRSVDVKCDLDRQRDIELVDE